MKGATIPIVFLFMLCFSGTLYGDAPDLETGVYIDDGGSPLDLSGYSAPTMADWNNDGRKDLLVGHINGYIWLFLNQGTKLNPVFNGGIRIESNGVPIKTTTS